MEFSEANERRKTVITGILKYGGLGQLPARFAGISG
jgi:hypothetical protein